MGHPSGNIQLAGNKNSMDPAVRRDSRQETKISELQVISNNSLAKGVDELTHGRTYKGKRKVG